MNARWNAVKDLYHADMREKQLNLKTQCVGIFALAMLIGAALGATLFYYLPFPFNPRLALWSDVCLYQQDAACKILQPPITVKHEEEGTRGIVLGNGSPGKSQKSPGGIRRQLKDHHVPDRNGTTAHHPRHPGKRKIPTTRQIPGDEEEIGQP